LRQSSIQAVIEYQATVPATQTNSSRSIQIVRRVPAAARLRLRSWRYRHAKRVLDVASAAILLALLAIPGAAIAGLVMLTSDGPVFYRERRIGRFGRTFEIWKFRSMYADAARRAHIMDAQTGEKVLEWRMHKNGRDPRITPIGHFLRKWSIDEVPQLINVLRGEMSLIGPRPIVQSEADFYGDLFAYYLAVTPGLSGLWQVSGRSDVGYDERAELDARYVSTWSIRSDFSILLRTLPAVLARRGAH